MVLVILTALGVRKIKEEYLVIMIYVIVLEEGKKTPKFKDIRDVNFKWNHQHMYWF